MRRRTCDDYMDRAGGGNRQNALLTEAAVGPLASDEDLESSAAYNKEKKQGGR